MREKKMDEEHSRESLPEEGIDAENIVAEENSVTKNITKVDDTPTEKTDKPVAREAWNTVYSREKRLEELRRKRMEAASQAANKPKDEPERDIPDDHSEPDSAIYRNVEKTVS